MSDHTITLLAHRRQVLRTALQRLIDGGRLPAPLMDYIDALYTRHRDFEAERIAGLALWLGKDSGTAWRETCFEGFGTVLRAARTVLHGVASLALDEGSADPHTTREQMLSGCGLSPALATRWCQLGRRYLSLTGATLPERGRRVQQLVHWLGGTTAPAEIGRALPANSTPAVTSLAVVEAATAEAVQALQTVSHCLCQVWLQRAWQTVAPSCDVFLDREVGVGATLGAALIALGQDSTMWPLLPQPLSRLEVVVTLLAHATPVTTHTECEKSGGPYG